VTDFKGWLPILRSAGQLFGRTGNGVKGESEVRGVQGEEPGAGIQDSGGAGGKNAQDS
jgi:hypothetical protein